LWNFCELKRMTLDQSEGVVSLLMMTSRLCGAHRFALFAKAWEQLASALHRFPQPGRPRRSVDAHSF
jgi:hypothetical protein